MSELIESLTPAQGAVFHEMKRGLAARPLVCLKGVAGRGMSTVLRALGSELGAVPDPGGV